METTQRKWFSLRQTRDFRDGRTPSQEISSPFSAWKHRNPPHHAPAAIKGLHWSLPTSLPAGLAALHVTHCNPTCGSRNILTGCSPLGPRHCRRPACCSSSSRGREIRRPPAPRPAPTPAGPASGSSPLPPLSRSQAVPNKAGTQGQRVTGAGPGSGTVRPGLERGGAWVADRAEPGGLGCGATQLGAPQERIKGCGWLAAQLGLGAQNALHRPCCQ